MNAKKLIALLLALTMIFALAACGNKPSVVGRWVADIDMVDQMVEEMDASVGGSKSFGEYLDSFVWELTLDLGADGTYTLKYDISRDIDSFKSSVVAYMRDMINELSGTEMSDELIAQALGMPLEDYAQTVVDAMTEAAVSESAKYKDDDKNLIWENGEKSPYTLTADELTFSVNSLGELHFKRVG